MPDSFLAPTRPSKVRRTSATDAAAPAAPEAEAGAHVRLLAVLAAAAHADVASALEATRALFEWLDAADTLEEKGRCALRAYYVILLCSACCMPGVPCIATTRRVADLHARVHWPQQLVPAATVARARCHRTTCA